KLYDPILISALNEETRRCSAGYAIKVFQDSLLAHRAAYVVGVPRCTLGELYRSLPCRDVRLGARAARFAFDDNRVIGVRLQNEELLAADAVVLATNRHA